MMYDDSDAVVWFKFSLFVIAIILGFGNACGRMIWMTTAESGPSEICPPEARLSSGRWIRMPAVASGQSGISPPESPQSSCGLRVRNQWGAGVIPRSPFFYFHAGPVNHATSDQRSPHHGALARCLR